MLRKFIVALRRLMRLPAKIHNLLVLKKNHVHYGKNFHINGRLCIRQSGYINIGDNVTINSRPNSNATSIGINSSFTVAPEGRLIIGNRTGMSHINITAMESVTLGDDILIGTNSIITDTDFHALNYDDRLKETRQGMRVGIRTAPVNICNGVFIGTRCIILKGITIGEGSVVGAGSVVSRNIPAGEIWAGNPAKFVRKVSVQVSDKLYEELN